MKVRGFNLKVAQKLVGYYTGKQFGEVERDD